MRNCYSNTVIYGYLKIIITLYWCAKPNDLLETYVPSNRGTLPIFILAWRVKKKLINSPIVYIIILPYHREYLRLFARKSGSSIKIKKTRTNRKRKYVRKTFMHTNAVCVCRTMAETAGSGRLTIITPFVKKMTARRNVFAAMKVIVIWKMKYFPQRNEILNKTNFYLFIFSLSWWISICTYLYMYIILSYIYISHSTLL